MENKQEMPKMSASEALTYSTVKLTAYINDKIHSSGTGFIMNLCVETDKCVPVIITNKHVIPDGAEIEFEFCESDEKGHPNDLKSLKCRLCETWLMHPDPNVDLCCIPIAQILREFEKQGKKAFYIPLSPREIPNEAAINDLTAMEDIVMIGYPTGIIDTYNHKPIIRKGVTATHIKKDYLGKKQFVIDIACYGGSSGSPVFILNEGSYMYQNRLHAGTRIYFVGVLYAGAIYDTYGRIIIMSSPNFLAHTQLPTNLGIVIKSSKILDFESIFWEMINQNKIKQEKVDDSKNKNLDGKSK